jgi:4-azaleucine resistance transporter AzlC
MPDSPRGAFWAGAQAELPILIGVMPFGMIYGALAVSNGIPFWPALGMSSIVFAGSAQFIAVSLIAQGTPFVLIVLTTFIVNLRHALYGAALAPHLRRFGGGWKALLAYLLTDEAFAVVIVHYSQEKESQNKHWYFLGAALALWSTWQTTTLIGILLGARIPPSWGLDFILPISFIALVVPPLKTRPAVASAAVAALVAVVAAGLPYQLGLMAAAAAGILMGLALEGNLRARVVVDGHGLEPEEDETRLIGTPFGRRPEP